MDERRPVVFLSGEVATPPFTERARVATLELLERLRGGDMPRMPLVRPMPSLGRRCHELRVRDGGVFWRIFIRIDEDVILVAGVEKKKSRKTPATWIMTCRRRLARFDVRRRGQGGRR